MNGSNRSAPVFAQCSKARVQEGDTAGDRARGWWGHLTVCMAGPHVQTARLWHCSAGLQLKLKLNYNFRLRQGPQTKHQFTYTVRVRVVNSHVLLRQGILS